MPIFSTKVVKFRRSLEGGNWQISWKQQKMHRGRLKRAEERERDGGKGGYLVIFNDIFLAKFKLN